MSFLRVTLFDGFTFVVLVIDFGGSDVLFFDFFGGGGGGGISSSSSSSEEDVTHRSITGFGISEFINHVKFT